MAVLSIGTHKSFSWIEILFFQRISLKRKILKNFCGITYLNMTEIRFFELDLD